MRNKVLANLIFTEHIKSKMGGGKQRVSCIMSLRGPQNGRVWTGSGISLLTSTKDKKRWSVMIANILKVHKEEDTKYLTQMLILRFIQVRNKKRVRIKTFDMERTIQPNTRTYMNTHREAIFILLSFILIVSLSLHPTRSFIITMATVAALSPVMLITNRKLLSYYSPHLPLALSPSLVFLSFSDSEFLPFFHPLLPVMLPKVSEKIQSNHVLCKEDNFV